MNNILKIFATIGFFGLGWKLMNILRLIEKRLRNEDE